MSWLLYVPVGAMLREGSAGHERPAADGQNADGQRRFRPRPGWGAQQRPQPGEKADGGRRLRLGAQSGGRRSRSAPCRRGAECRKRGTAVGRQGALCARGWQRGAGGGGAGPVAVPLRTRTAAPHRLAVTQPGTRALFAPPEPGECSRGELWAPRAAVKSLPAICLAAAEMRGGESCSPRCCRSPRGTAVCCSPSSELPAVLRVYRCIALLTLPLGPVHLQGRRYGGAGRRSRSTERSRAGAVGLILLPKRTRLRFELSPGAVRGHSCLSSAGASRAARD